MSQGTRCHQLAMFVVYDSPLQIFSGNPSQGLKEPGFMKLLGEIPVLWDETSVLQGKIGEYIITARKKGNDWFIAGLNNQIAREVVLPLNFLDKNSFDATLCSDGINAHNYGSDYQIAEMTIQQDQSLKIKMAPGGGFLLKLIRTGAR
jgi:alpha-glucosidase